MSRGISSIISVVLLLMIVIAFTAAFFLFSSRTMATTQSSIDQNLNRASESTMKCLKYESASGNDIYVRNCGSSPINGSALGIYIDGSVMTFSIPASINPNEIGTLTITSPLSAGEHSIKISGGGMDINEYSYIGGGSSTTTTASPTTTISTTTISITTTTAAGTTTTMVVATTTTVTGIILTSPNGGEVWQRGTTHTVTWTYTGAISGHYVILTLLKAGVEIGTINASTPIGSGGSGSFVWDIYAASANVGNDFKVRIQSINQSTINDESNGNFTLTLAATTTTITPVTTTIAGNLSLQGVQIFPADHIMNTKIDSLPADSRSQAYINTIGNSSVFTFYFGFPYNVVDSTQAKQRFASIERLAYSDDVPFPIPQNPAIETLCADRHMLIIDRDSRMLYESYMTNQLANGSWTCGATSVWNLSNYSFRKNNASPMWSVDAAGLPLFPALLRYDEVAAGSINHTIRFTVTAMRGDYVWNARASAPWGAITNLSYPPAGQRFRLKASVNISRYPTQARVILTALRNYGLILADNGGPFAISGVPDSRWNSTDIYTLQNPGPLQLHASDFEAVNVSSVMINPNSCQAMIP